MHKQAKGSILLLLCAMIWGAAFVAQSESMQYIGPFTMGAARFFLGGLPCSTGRAGRRTGRSQGLKRKSSCCPA